MGNEESQVSVSLLKRLSKLLLTDNQKYTTANIWFLKKIDFLQAETFG